MVGTSTSRGAMVWAERMLWAVAVAALLGLVGAAFSNGSGRPGNRDSTSSPSLVNVNRPEAAQLGSPASVPATQRLLRTKPIESIRVGERVLAQNPDPDNDLDDEEEPNPQTWREIRFRLQKSDGSFLDLTLLREVEWIREYKVEAGGRVFLDLEEMGAVGEAEVVYLGPCPAIEPSRGSHYRVVTGTFRHVSDRVIDLYVTGQSGPIGVTDNHPFWSADREQFVAAGSLRPNERLQTFDGDEARLVRVIDRPGNSVVHNLEVNGEHVYFVGDHGLLVHNHCVYRELVNGVLKYVGITNNFARRAGEHLRLYTRVINVIPELANITRKEARAIEHLLIQKYGRVKDRTGKLLNGQLNNTNGGIDMRDKKNLKKYKKELEWAAEKIKELGL